jgi:hypothetical protein
VFWRHHLNLGYGLQRVIQGNDPFGTKAIVITNQYFHSFFYH